jgi:hypothetical protein
VIFGFSILNLLTLGLKQRQRLHKDGNYNELTLHSNSKPPKQVLLQAENGFIKLAYIQPWSLRLHLNCMRMCTPSSVIRSLWNLTNGFELNFTDWSRICSCRPALNARESEHMASAIDLALELNLSISDHSISCILSKPSLHFFFISTKCKVADRKLLLYL